MSRGFVKEEDQEETPIIPPRAALPAGVTNYVTPLGLELLLQEKEDLEKQYSAGGYENDTEKRRAHMVLNGKLQLLNERINSARVLNPADQPKDEVRFGATVSLKPKDKKAKFPSMNFTIVGVDEANVKEGKIAFVAPIARAVTGKKKGDEVELKLGAETRLYLLTNFSY